MITFDKRKYDAWMRKVLAATGGKSPSVEVYCKPAGGKSGAELVGITEAQRVWGRDPWFLSEHMQGAVSKIVLEKIVKPLNAGRTVNLRTVLVDVGEQMVKAFLANYRNARSTWGRFRKVSAARRVIKERTGLDARPMFADGDLYASIAYRIKP